MALKRSEIISSIGTLQVDAIVDIKDSYKNSLNKYRIETGSEVTENAYTENTKLSLSGVISDAIVPQDKSEAPLVSVKQDRLPDFTPGFISQFLSKSEKPTVKILGADPSDIKISRYQDAKAFLKKLRSTRELITIRTPRELYENVLITSLEFSRDKGTGRSISFKMSLEEPQFAVSKETESTRKSNTTIQKSVPKTDQGWRATDPVEQGSDEESSVAVRIFGARADQDFVETLGSILLTGGAN